MKYYKLIEYNQLETEIEEFPLKIEAVESEITDAESSSLSYLRDYHEEGLYGETFIFEGGYHKIKSSQEATKVAVKRFFEVLFSPNFLDLAIDLLVTIVSLILSIFALALIQTIYKREDLKFSWHHDLIEIRDSVLHSLQLGLEDARAVIRDGNVSNYYTDSSTPVIWALLVNRSPVVIMAAIRYLREHLLTVSISHNQGTIQDLKITTDHFTQVRHIIQETGRFPHPAWDELVECYKNKKPTVYSLKKYLSLIKDRAYDIDDKCEQLREQNNIENKQLAMLSIAMNSYELVEHFKLINRSVEEENLYLKQVVSDMHEDIKVREQIKTIIYIQECFGKLLDNSISKSVLDSDIPNNDAFNTCLEDRLQAYAVQIQEASKKLVSFLNSSVEENLEIT